ncbi:hypothetical protein Fcan01_28425 [Folsomia candida]|uniref:Uncharacterized protein n=1 Tax=Folsomia candida TaxID=158441 RepID=A0A226CTN6_FOLCA|nr:hypothetical protein Fcan01_28425 [Folsomia candida]
MENKPNQNEYKPLPRLQQCVSWVKVLRANGPQQSTLSSTRQSQLIHHHLDYITLHNANQLQNFTFFIRRQQPCGFLSSEIFFLKVTLRHPENFTISQTPKKQFTYDVLTDLCFALLTLQRFRV